MQTQVPKKLNGLPVLASCAGGTGYHTVMMERPGFQPFVVATWWPDLETSWSWGHYCDTREEADGIFAQVATLNARRGVVMVEAA